MEKVNIKRFKIYGAAAGVFAGLINGLFGGSGGMILVPALKRLGFSQKQAQAGSIMAVLCFCAASVIMYSAKTHINLNDTGYFVGGLIGGVLGAKLLPFLPDTLLRKAFALFALYGAGRILFNV
jgi:uncharacterized membrane protein YfcA